MASAWVGGRIAYRMFERDLKTGITVAQKKRQQKRTNFFTKHFSHSKAKMTSYTPPQTITVIHFHQNTSNYKIRRKYHRYMNIINVPSCRLEWMYMYYDCMLEMKQTSHRHNKIERIHVYDCTLRCVRGEQRQA